VKIKIDVPAVSQLTVAVSYVCVGCYCGWPQALPRCCIAFEVMHSGLQLCACVGGLA